MFGTATQPAGLEALSDELSALASQISQLQAEQVQVVRRIEQSHAVSDMTTAAWVAWRAGLTPGEAHRLVRLAKRLPALPQIEHGFEQGRLSEGVVTALLAVATPENESAVLETTRVATGAQLQRLLRTYKRTRNAERPADTDETVSYGSDDDGMWRLSARLRAENGARLEAALSAARGAHHEAGVEPLTQPEALAALADGYLAGSARADGILPERYQTIVHLDGDTLDAHLRSGGHLERHTITELLCESWITFVVTNGSDVTITSPTRLATPSQHRALLERDRTCRFPGCGRTRHLRAHHITHHEHGGATQLDNMVLLCQRHHTVVHLPEWLVERRATTGGLRVVDPHGTEITGHSPDRRPPGCSPPPRARARCIGTNERLTAFGADDILHHWHRSTA
jgi:hypothetical protein